MNELTRVEVGQVWQKKYPPNRLRVVPAAFVVVRVASLYVTVENTTEPKRPRMILTSCFKQPGARYRLVGAGLKTEES